MQYWYSAQLRQYRLQFIRAFSGFYVQTGNGGPNNTKELLQVPCRYGDPSRVAAAIVSGNSENKIPSVPFITCYISGLNMSASRRQDPQLVVPVQVNERKYDDEQGRYTSEVGNRYTVDRIMPVPYDLTMQVDFWTSNLDQKEQLLEQILVLYNPSIDVQTSTNPIDWTVLSYIEMQDNITWTSRTIPMGTDNPIDVASMVFKIPIWINPPAKVKKQTIIQEIITNIVQGSYDQSAQEWTEYEFLTRTITTPANATIKPYPHNGQVYSISLCDDSGSNIDQQGLPTYTRSSILTTVPVGISFIWNGITCAVSHSALADAVNDIRNSLVGTNLTCQLQDGKYIQFINTSGGDNTFIDLQQGSLASLGLQATTYPGGKLAWWRLLELYGAFRSYADYGANASQLRFKTVDDIEQTSTDIVGWFDIYPTDQNRILWSPDPQNWPSTTLDPINAIVDPHTSGPGITLAPTAVGQRYLLTDAPSNTSTAWGTVDAKQDDIIEFNGVNWQVSWSSSTNGNVTQYVYNNKSGKIYKWNSGYWASVIGNEYQPGYWRLSL